MYHVHGTKYYVHGTTEYFPYVRKGGENMMMKCYTVPNSLKWNYVFIFITDPYRETSRFHQYHKRKRVWVVSNDGICVKCGTGRTHQIERMCQLSGFKSDIEVR